MDTNPSSSIRSALSGHNLLVVGGDPRVHALRRLEVAFNLAEARHCRTRKCDPSPWSFYPLLQKFTPILVVWVAGLSRTNHGKHLHRLCRELGIPFIDCFRIPHPNQLAARITDLRLLDALHRRRMHVGGAR